MISVKALKQQKDKEKWYLCFLFFAAALAMKHGTKETKWRMSQKGHHDSIKTSTLKPRPGDTFSVHNCSHNYH